MGTYNLPRNVKGEGRILFVFSTKALIYTVVGIGIGFIFYLIFSLVKLNIVGIIAIVILALLGFAIGTLKVPETNAFEITKKTGGENIDDVIKRAIKFKMNNKKIYVYDFDKKGEKLLKYYDITTYDYILDYDMDKQKTYYENNCKEIDQKTYKSCNVVLDNKKIIITSEIDLNSEVAKEYLATVSLNDVKENYADTPYTCK